MSRSCPSSVGQQYSWLPLPVLVFALLFSLWQAPCAVRAQDTFSNTTCRDIGLGVGTVCLIFEVQGCTNTDLVLHVNRSGSEVFKLLLQQGQQYSQSFFNGACTAQIQIANSPWTLTPTYAHFTYSGDLRCFGGTIDVPFDSTEVFIGEDCNAHRDCHTCLQSAICGWCESGAGGGYVTNQRCFAENNAEVQPFCGTCGQWYFNTPGTCPNLPPPHSSSSTGAAGPASSSTGSSGGSTDDGTPSSPALSTGGALALGFVLGGGAIAAAGAAGTWWWWKKRRGGRIRVKTEEEHVAVEMRDGEEPLNDEKVSSDDYEAPRERGAVNGHMDDFRSLCHLFH